MTEPKCCGNCRWFVVSYFDPYQQLDCGRCEHGSLAMVEKFIEDNQHLIASSVRADVLPRSQDDGTDCPCHEMKGEE